MCKFTSDNGQVETTVWVCNVSIINFSQYGTGPESSPSHWFLLRGAAPCTIDPREKTGRVLLTANSHDEKSNVPYPIRDSEK